MPMAAAADRRVIGPPTTPRRQNHGRCVRHRAARARAFECMVCHCQVRQFGASPGDHSEGHFEGAECR
jgi:hypothetical protein